MNEQEMTRSSTRKQKMNNVMKREDQNSANTETEKGQ